jgi:hypothetical protein
VSVPLFRIAGDKDGINIPVHKAQGALLRIGGGGEGRNLRP